MSDEFLQKALKEELVKTIFELQSLPSLHSFALAGGTNLALRFNHRISVDIDLFSSQVVGVAGLKTIQSDLEEFYKEHLINCELLDPEAGEQYCFLRAFIHKGSELVIKVEIIQNISLVDPMEYFEDIRILSQRDIGLLKLMSASNRKAKKDIYDLDFITDQIPLANLIVMLEEKQLRFEGDQFRCLFDLDHEQSPINDLNLLLAFDKTDYTALPLRPNHSIDAIDIIPPNKSWVSARSSWRRKVIMLMRSRGMTPPSIRPIN